MSSSRSKKSGSTAATVAAVMNPSWPPLTSVIESLLFIADKPLSESDIVDVLLRQHAEDQDAMDEENDRLEKEGRANPAAAPALMGTTGDLFSESAQAGASEEPLEAEAAGPFDDAAVSGITVTIREADGSPMIAEVDDELEGDSVHKPLPLGVDSVLEGVEDNAEPANPDVSASDDSSGESTLLESMAVPLSDVVSVAASVASDEAGTADDNPTNNESDVLVGEVLSAEAAESAAPSQPVAPDPTAGLRKVLMLAVRDAFGVLANTYARSTGYELVAVAGGYQLRTNPRVAAFVRQYLQVKPTRLSRAQLETLAIVAYRQPVTRPEMEQIRGVDCGAAMKILLERKLVRILGKKEEVGRPLLYGTTKEFLEFFNLKSLMELPTLREFQELSEEHQRKVEEELDRDKPLGSMKELAENAPQLEIDDSAMISDLDSALSNARKTVNRVAELTGMKPIDEEVAPPATDLEKEAKA